MNRQINYIIYAFLILLLVPPSIFILKIIVSNNSSSENSTPIDVQKAIEPSDPNYDIGKNLFMNKCASCHSIFKDIIGPALIEVLDRGPWGDRNKLYEWIRNPDAFMERDAYTSDLKKKNGTMMLGFPNLTNADIEAIVLYINVESESSGNNKIAEAH